MILIHNFKEDLRSYACKGTNNEFPEVDQCPSCGSKKRLGRHGFYWRYGIAEVTTERIPICRLKCDSCKKTFSILPDFLIPFFQHTVHTVLSRVGKKLNGERTGGSRQLTMFYVKRFLAQLNWIYTFFSDLGELLEIAGEKKERAKKKKILAKAP